MVQTDAVTEVLEGTEPSLGLTSGVSWQAGVRIGRYLLLEHIGAGGMGDVYRARDERLGRDVALKRWRSAAGPLSRGVHVRMQREAQAMAQLNHPNVVPIYDVDSSPDGLLIAMEYVEGTTLKVWLEDERPWPEVIRTLVEAGRGLAAAHAAGIVHRDFKPANVLLGGDARPRVTDFGLAQGASTLGVPTERDSQAQPVSGDVLSGPLTEAGAVMGTPLYMAPEQFERTPAIPATDQYAFCLVLYEGLYRQRPFTGRGSDLTDAKSGGRLRPAPSASPVPHRVFKILRRGLSADPADRWQSMDVLLDRLERTLRRSTARTTLFVAAAALLLTTPWLASGLDAQDHSCAASSEIDDLWNASRRARLERAFADSGLSYASSTATIVTGRLDAFAHAWHQVHASSCEALAEGPVEDMSALDTQLACLQRQARRFQATLDVLEAVDADTVPRAAALAGSLPDPSRCAEPRERTDSMAPPTDPDLAGDVEDVRDMLAASDAALAAGRYEAGTQTAQRALQAAASLDYPPLKAEALLHAGRANAAAERLDAAEQQLTDAYVLASELGYGDVSLDAAVRMVALVGDEGGRPADAEPWIRRAETELARFEHPTRHSVMLASHKGRVLSTAERWNEPELRRAVDLGREGGIPRVDLAGDIKDLATVLKHLERHEEAAALLGEALEILGDELGADHPSRAITLDELGNVLRAMGRLDEALQVQRDALSMHRRVFGDDNTYVTTSLNNVAVTLGRLERHEEAIEKLELAVDITERMLGPDHPDVARMSSNLASAYVRHGNDEKAEALYLRAHDILVRALGSEAPPVAIVSVNLGDRYLALGRPDEAAKFFEQAQAIARARRLPTLAVAAIDFGRARVMWEQGRDRGGALQLARTALNAVEALGEGARRDRDQIANWIEERT